MNIFLGCQLGGGKSLSALTFLFLLSSGSAFGLSIESDLILASTDKTKMTTATMEVSVGDQKYTCKGSFRFNSFSIMGCGEQRQVQVEVQTVNSSENALVSIYEPGRQAGKLFLAKLEGESFKLLNESAIVIPGFGYVQIFAKYIYNPMVSKVGEAATILALPLWIQSLRDKSGKAPTLGTLRDRIESDDYRAFLPKLKELQPKAKEQNLKKEQSQAEVPIEEEMPKELPKKSQETVKQDVPPPIVVEPEVSKEIQNQDQDPEEVQPQEVEIIDLDQQPISKETPTLLVEPDSGRLPPPNQNDYSARIREEDRKKRESFFGDSQSGKGAWVNPYGLDLQSMSKEELKKYEARNLIWRK